jgi:hypothetical protein
VRCSSISKRSYGRTLAVLFQGGNVQSLSFKYVIMMLDFYLVVVASLDML